VAKVKASAEQSSIGRRRAIAREQGTELYDERRSKILASAKELFRAKGYRGTTFADLSESVGMDRATIYYYFGSKEEIFDFLVRDLVKGNRNMVQDLADAEGPASERLRRFIVTLLVSYAEHFPFLYIYLEERMGHVAPSRQAWADEMRPVNRQFEDAIVSLVQQGFEDGSLRARGDARVVAYGILGMVSWSHRWFDPDKSVLSAEEIGETYADVILRGLGSD
jgi:TetR/AcrR family transcriptional regulator, cholesterol catabolism regulator